MSNRPPKIHAAKIDYLQDCMTTAMVYAVIGSWLLFIFAGLPIALISRWIFWG